MRIDPPSPDPLFRGHRASSHHELQRLLILSPFGVNPARSGGHVAVLEPARQLARAGVDVHLFGWGLRRFEAFEHWRSFVRVIEPRLIEHRHVSLINWIDYLRRGRTGLPPVDAGRQLWRRASTLLRIRMAAAQVIQCECPWLWSFIPPDRPRVLVAQNVEADLADQNPKAKPRDRARIAAAERTAWREADAVICLTEEDRAGLARRYGDRPAHVIPLGVDPEAIKVPSDSERARARQALGVSNRFVVLFTGAWHRPNRDAMERMIAWGEAAAACAGAGSDCAAKPLFVIAGTVGRKEAHGATWRVTGPVDDLGEWFRAADCCVNPMSTGSGANVKILEYLAWGTPVISTPFGARGLTIDSGEHMLVRPLEEFPEAIDKLRNDRACAHHLALAGRAWVENERSWEVIAGRRRGVLDAAARGALVGAAAEKGDRHLFARTDVLGRLRSES